VLASLSDAKPETGKTVAIVGSDLPTYANGQRFVKRATLSATASPARAAPLARRSLAPLARHPPAPLAGRAYSASWRPERACG
jgi:hypothetical protein